MVNLAELYIAKRKYGEALAMYQRVLPIYEKAFGPVNDQTAIIVDSLAFLSYIKGDFDEAERFYQRALSSRELAGSERREVAQALYKLAEFYRSRREFKKAEPLFLRAIAINDKLDTQNDPDAYKTILRYVCFLYESRSTNEEAQKAEREFFEGRKTKTPLEPSSSLSGGVVNGRAISLPRPAFPDEARQLRATGIVRVQVLIDETGKVIEAKVLCGHPVFGKPALESAYRARFTPTKLSGMGVKVNGIIVYNFGR